MSEIVEQILQSQAQQPTAQAESQAQPGENQNHSAEFLERFNKLASKEAALRKREQESMRERDSYKSKVERLNRLEQLANEDPESLLGEFGLNYDKLTERRLSSLGGEQDKAFSSLQKEVQELKAMLGEKEKANSDAQNTQAMQAARAEIERICESDDFELIRINDQFDLVLDTAAEYFQATDGKVLSLVDAAKHVEAHLEQRLEKLQQSKKFTSRLQKSGEEPRQNSGQLPAESPRGLSNSLSGASRPAPTPMSEDDLREAFWRALGTPKG